MNRWLTILFATVSTMCFAAVSPFTVEVCVGDSTEPTMIFGVASEAETFPMPPYSGMFGVKDLYIDGGDTSGDYKRLSTDIRATGAGESYDWVICSTNAGATLTFKKSEGAPTLYYGYIDKKGNAQSAELTDTLSVKSGINYVISTATIASDAVAGKTTVAEDPAHPYFRIAKDETTGIYSTDEMIKPLGSAGDYLLSFAPDTDSVAVVYTNTDGKQIYLLNADGTNTSMTEDALKSFKGWICEVKSNDSITYDASKIFSNGAFSMTFTTTTDNTAIELTITTTSGSAKQMGCYVSPLDGAAIVAAALMRYTKGTLDFDQNGVVNIDDATYLYNYASKNCSDKLTAKRLMDYTTYNATEQNAGVALQYFRDNFDELFFDGSESTVDDGKANTAALLDCATYFYNYASKNFSDKLTAKRLMDYTTYNATEQKAGAALETMKELKEE